ncbi:ABC transporter ATP-binding protein [Shimia sp. R9_3]|nr:ABC transporter ATP-binding protein [Shimia sp. R9_3]
MANEAGLTTVPLLGERSTNFVLALFVLAFFFRSSMLVFLSFFQATTVFKIQAEISSSLFRKYLKLNKSSEKTRNVNLLAKNVIVEAQSITQHGYVPMIAIASDTVIAAVLISYLIYLNGSSLLVISVLFGVLIYLMAAVVRGHLGRLGTLRKEMDGVRYQYVNEAFEQRDLIFAHRLFDFFWRRYDRVNERSAHAGGLQSGLNMSTRWIVEFIIISILAVILLLNGGHVPELSQIAVTAGIAIRLLPLSSKMLANFQRLDYSGPVLEELSEQLADQEADAPLNSAPLEPQPRPFEISFGGAELVVSGQDGPYFQKFVNMTLESNRVYAVTGPNGVGKSTFIKVLLGSVKGDLQAGSIVISSSNELEASLTSPQLLDNLAIGYVPQDPILLDATVRENLSLGMDISDSVVWTMLERVGLERYVHDLPKGLDTLVGDKYGFFSGGQRQRLAIARALIFGGDIIVLDEPTSATDDAFAKDVVNLLKSDLNGAMVLIVTHSSAVVGACDARITVFQDKISVQA